MKINSIIPILLIVAMFSSCNIYNTNKTPFTIGSGSKNAMYYPVAIALCDVFNKHNKDKSVICEAKLSKGAQYNLDAVENGEFDMGISQTNLQYDAYKGRGKFANHPHKNLRTLLRVHDEYMTIIVKKDSGINSFSDLHGKKINIGNEGSGSIILFSQMLKKLGWSLKDFKEIYKESGSNINKVLCVPDKADAAIYIVGHPNKSFGAMLKNCNAKLINLSDSEIKTFISIAPTEFHKAIIPYGTYAENPEQINTFASKTILSTSAKLDPKIVNNFVKIISENKEELIKEQPSLTNVDFYWKSHPKLAPAYQ